MSRFVLSASRMRWMERVLAERFGQVWRLLQVEDDLLLKAADGDGAIIFKSMCDGFVQSQSDQPCTQWNAQGEGWLSAVGDRLPAPGYAELRSPLIEKLGANHVVHFDILGLCYWMLLRVEEIGRQDLDAHQRFPATSSHAFKYGYLDRPIVDEWLYILGQVIQRQWPGLELPRHRFQMCLSHDVDRPSRYGFVSLKNLSRRMVGDAVRGDLLGALSGPWVRMNSRKELHPFDRFNTFDSIMDMSDSHGLTSTFNFICGNTSHLDADYDIDHPAIRSLLRKVHNRGHEIGLHPSYNTYDRPSELKFEASRLRNACMDEGIYQSIWGGRMHYLRWRSPDTLRAWANASMDYDSTLTYADHAGFRTGSCFEYPAFDPVKEIELSVRIRPLIAMEGSVLSKIYMGHDEKEALDVFRDLKTKCRQVGGNFTLLWHNSELTRWPGLYSCVLSA